MPHHKFRFEQPLPKLPVQQPTGTPQPPLREELPQFPKPEPPVEQAEPIRVTPNPRRRSDVRPEAVPGALSMLPKASMIPRSSPKTWQQTPSQEAE